MRVLILFWVLARGCGSSPMDSMDAATTDPDSSTPVDDASAGDDADVAGDAQVANDAAPPEDDSGTPSTLTFFVTSVGLDGGDLGGLEGADAHCQALADAAGAGDHTWHAYLSTTNGTDVHAKDRIGDGPWFNADGVMIAADIEELHGDNNLNATTAIDENGDPILSDEHDIMTGSNANGTAFDDRTCNDWTSNTSAHKTRVGHHNRMGGGEAGTSWNSAHETMGCSEALLIKTACVGFFYCFAIN